MIGLPAKAATERRLNTSIISDPSLPQNSVFSNQSANLQDIKKLTSEEV
jgi:hypothetical protein